MNPLVLSSALLLLAPAAAGASDPFDPAEGTQITIHQRIILRIQRGPGVVMSRATVTAAAPPPPVQWVEKHAPKCVAAIDLAAAAITSADSVDLVLNGGKRLRARLEDHCPALAFYSGVYLRPTADGKVCADRDAILARSGAECRIDKFRTLVVKR